MNITRKISLLVLLFCFLQTTNVSSQDLDSLLKVSLFEVYENPERAIESGTLIYEAKDASVDLRARALLMIATAHTSKRDYKKSADYALRARNILNGTTHYVTQLKALNQLGLQYHYLHIHDKAIQYLDEAQVLIKQHIPNDTAHDLLGNTYALRGFIYHEKMSGEVALSYFDSAINEFEKALANPLMNANLSIMHYNKGNCYLEISKKDSAMICFQRALESAEKISARSLEGFAMKGMAEVYTALGQYDNALNVLKLSAEVSDSVGDLILNKGIYKGMADNYLAINDWNQSMHWNEKYTSVMKTIQQNERNSIHRWLADQETAILSQQNAIQKKQRVVIFGTLGVVLLLAIFIFKRFRFQRNRMTEMLKRMPSLAKK